MEKAETVNRTAHKAPADFPSPLAMAYLGDAYYEVFVRRFLIDAGLVKVNELHRQAVRLVCANAQDQLLRWLEPQLDETEKDWVRRGRNANSGRCPASTDIATYRRATGFECLVGYWSLTLPERLECIRPYLEEMAGAADRKGEIHGR